MTYVRLFLFATAVLFAACPGSLDNPEAFGDAGNNNNNNTIDAQPPADAAKTCAKDVEKDILGSSLCAGSCHGSTNPLGSLDLASPNVASRLVSKPAAATECGSRLLIDPANPTGGVFLETMTSATPCGKAGLKMPLGGTVSSADLACIQEWVASVAGGGN